MAGDYSRDGFDARKHFSQVRLQQGRVLTDRDWNEHGDIFERRFRAQTVDTLGRCVVPAETPDGFRISIDGSGDEKSLSIGTGRIYVDGLLAESHGTGLLQLDMSLARPDGTPSGVLAEEVGQEPISYFEQPYWHTPDPLPENGVLTLVYLVVWEREVTRLVDDSLLEPALGGVDTTIRCQTAWQVRGVTLAHDITCSSPDADIDQRLPLCTPSAARLTTRIVEEDVDDNPCLIPDTSGYTGAENQLYRVQIHDGGTPGNATIKWSRDNASVAARITKIDGRDVTVDLIGRDSVLRFENNNWIEITSDIQEFEHDPGFMVRITRIEGNVVTLADDLPEDFFPEGFDTKYNPRVIKWDNPDGPISISQNNAEILLGHGIAIDLEVEPSSGEFRTGDYWTFAARTATGDIDRLERAPPQGIHYHCCRLALVRWPADDNEQARVDDCRIKWPSFGSESCACSVCVSPETHNNGALTINQAIAQVAGTGGTVCLQSGEYDLGQVPVQCIERSSVCLRGQGRGTTLSFSGFGAALVIDSSSDIKLDGLSFVVSGSSRLEDSLRGDQDNQYGVGVRNSIDVTIAQCAFSQVSSETTSATGIMLDSVVLGGVFEDNSFFLTSGIQAARVSADGTTASNLLSDLVIAGNQFMTQRHGVVLDRLCFLEGSSHIRGNSFQGCAKGAILSTGVVLPGSRLDVRDNQIAAQGSGIVMGTNSTRICDNDISSPTRTGAPDGIVVTEGADKTGIEGCYITGNRLVNLPGRAIVIGHAVNTAMIKQNIMESIDRGGLLMTSNATASALEIENNQLINIAQSFNPQTEIAAIRLVNTDRLLVANNLINGVAVSALQSPFRAGIHISGCKHITIGQNEIVGVGPLDPRGDTAGVQLSGPISNGLIQGNKVRRTDDEQDSPLPESWYALRISRKPSSGGVGPSVGNLATVFHVAIGRSLFAFDDRFTVNLGEFSDSRISVQGNHLEGGGLVPAVQIDVEDTCLLTGNHISGGRFTAGVETARIAATRAIASNNSIHGLNGAISLSITADVFAVVGNVTSGPIQANQAIPESAAGLGLNVVHPGAG